MENELTKQEAISAFLSIRRKIYSMVKAGPVKDANELNHRLCAGIKFLKSWKTSNRGNFLIVKQAKEWLEAIKEGNDLERF